MKPRSLRNATAGVSGRPPVDTAHHRWPCGLARHVVQDCVRSVGLYAQRTPTMLAGRTVLVLVRVQATRWSRLFA